MHPSVDELPIKLPCSPFVALLTILKLTCRHVRAQQKFAVFPSLVTQSIPTQPPLNRCAVFGTVKKINRLQIYTLFVSTGL